ncbi:MAG TPA: alpha/beta fold hydrolase [Candidatus Margulisiibacteriota bacterium]|nr:alpha/beta fold hydrolase [Candidatus Margulisiibacteriota bacterium]
MSSEAIAIRRPPRGLLFLEGRALLELAALLPAYPVLRRAPRGDGHPVLVLPGFLASDFSTRALRGFLRNRGYGTHGWQLGRNLGPNPDLIGALVQRFQELRRRYDRKLSLIGWSLGGVYARELARNFPSDVRQVITLASPFRDLSATSVPPLLRRFGARHRPANDSQRAQLGEPIPVPATAIYSKTDGIAAWQSCLETPGPLSENIEVESSHIGIGHHPIVLLTIADRLAQPEGEWKPFQAPAGWRWPWVPRRATAAP